MPGLHEDICSDPRKLAREIQNDIWAGEEEIAEAIEAGYQFRDRRRAERPERALKWAVDMFGPIAMDQRERTMRFLEEAIELAHALKLDRNTVQAIVARVYGRSPGYIPREIGQSLMTLEVLAQALGHDAEREAESEFDRVQTIPKQEWERRHSAKQALGIAERVNGGNGDNA